MFLIYAFDALDGDDRLSDISCEALDLLSLPALQLNPVSKQLEANKVSRLLYTSGKHVRLHIVQLLQQKAFPQPQSLKDMLIQSRNGRISSVVPITSLSRSITILHQKKFKDQLSSTITSSITVHKDSACNRGAASPRPGKAE